MTSERLPVLITAIGGGGHGDQILKAIRLADSSRYYIVGADASSYCPQSKLVDEFVTLPFANHPGYMAELFSVCKSLGIKALFHGCEPELKLFAAERKRIEEHGIFLPINPTALIDVCMNKMATNQKLSELGFAPPKFFCAKNKEDLKQVDWYPVIVKPSIGGGGSANVYLAQNLTELLGLADYLGIETVAAHFMIQEYVGTPDEEYTVGVLHDMDGNLINSIAIRRVLSGGLSIRSSMENRTEKAELGQKLVISSGVSQGFVGRFSNITRQCEEIASDLGAQGAINIQCRVVNGVVKVFEINPRFSGTTSLRAMMGYNEPDLLLRRHLFGETLEKRFDYEEGLILRSLTEHRMNR